MDQIHKISIQDKSEFKIESNETKYWGLLELIDERIKITLTLGLSQFKWCGIFSIEQLIKKNGVFFMCNTIEKSFEYLKQIINSNGFEIKKDGSQVNLNYSQVQFNLQVTFSLELQQEQVSSIESLNSINNSILEMQKKIEELETNLKNKDQKINQQDEVINAQKIEIEDLKQQQKNTENNLLKNDKIQMDLIQQLKLVKYSKILYIKDLETIGKWIHKGNKEMKLKLLYRATEDGFQTSKFFEKCSNISQTLVLIKTTEKIRFGGYTNLLWQTSNAFQQTNNSPDQSSSNEQLETTIQQQQNNNNNNTQVNQDLNLSFTFSLDKSKKYKRNSNNLQYEIYGNSDYFAFGSNYIYDICIKTNSDDSFQSYAVQNRSNIFNFKNNFQQQQFHPQHVQEFHAQQFNQPMQQNNQNNQINNQNVYQINNHNNFINNHENIINNQINQFQQFTQQERVNVSSKYYFQTREIEVFQVTLN